MAVIRFRRREADVVAAEGSGGEDVADGKFVGKSGLQFCALFFFSRAPFSAHLHKNALRMLSLQYI